MLIFFRGGSRCWKLALAQEFALAKRAETKLFARCPLPVAARPSVARCFASLTRMETSYAFQETWEGLGRWRALDDNLWHINACQIRSNESKV